jgi:hypothetical protein
MESMQIRDLLYFDFDKAASIWSQFAGGLRERISITEDKVEDHSTSTRIGIPKLAEAGFGAEKTDTTSVLGVCPSNSLGEL